MNNKTESYLVNILFSLNGKLEKRDFLKIKKFYKWKFSYKKIHIVGTNGKGSNAKYLNDELILNSYKVGLFTSPHIINVCERIQINQNDIDFEKLIKYTTDFQFFFPEINFGFFDLLFLSALRWFEESDIDVAIFEAGIGAKKDVVNYLNHDITLITSISLDHEKILGFSVERIALDKSYSIKTSNNVYISGAINKNIVDLFLIKAKKENNENINIVDVDKNTFESINQSLSKYVLQKEFDISVFQSLFFLPKARVQKVIINKINCYIDVAHNVEAIQATIDYFRYYDICFDQVVLSLSEDKDFKKIIEKLKYNYKKIIVYENKGRKPLKLSHYGLDCFKIYSIESFLKRIDVSTLFIGSFYFVGKILKEVTLNE